MNERLPQFASPRDHVLWVMSREAWACELSGSETQFVAWMSNTEAELTEIVDVFNHAFNQAGLDSSHALLGNFVIRASKKQVEVSEYPSEDEARRAYREAS